MWEVQGNREGKFSREIGSDYWAVLNALKRSVVINLHLCSSSKQVSALSLSVKRTWCWAKDRRGQ